GKGAGAGGGEAGDPGVFAAAEGATGQAAASGDAGNDAGGNTGVELAGGEVIEEEQGLCTLNHQIVHAHRHEVDADGVVAVCVNGEFDLGADAIGRGNQQRIVIARSLGIEESAESPKVAVRA